MTIDEQLRQLAMTAKQHPPQSLERQKVLEQLFQVILHSGRLCHPQRGKFSFDYDEIYQEAIQNLFLFICLNIDKYNPGLGEVMTWCNVLLRRRFFREAIPEVIGRPGIQRVSLSDLDNLASPEAPLYLEENLKNYIKSDPDNLFKTTYIQNHPEANFSALVMQRLEGKSWQEISASFGIKVPTLNSFFRRCLDRFNSTIRQYLDI